MGGGFNTVWDCEALIENQLSDNVRTADEALAARWPYRRAYLPVNRLRHDGTLWNW